ncbi:metal-dependent hydrolase family protein [Vibrio agarivorans]|uniref:Amidohydrolase family protein n=1 Tax=Vibrio agarivorans TaxID=153622 RepID=A0ABT7Y499_9VIBR|nr:amidohydrolase family protein [Vibrio agarivorans]MDN2482874.1 amidohydrolase family protein [Vibrio agarivorans]
MKKTLKAQWLSKVTIAATATLFSAASLAESSYLIINAKVFDGQSEQLTEPQQVLVEGNKITKISPQIEQPKDSIVIDADGRTLSPGFIAAHEHLVGQMSFGELFAKDTRYKAYVATQTVEQYLMNGFTAVRDLAGNTFSLRDAIDSGYIKGPRIFPSGPMISQTSGHADHRWQSHTNALQGGSWDTMEREGDMLVVDGVPDMLKAVRENLRQGASQIKIAVGGGTGSFADPLDTVQFTPEEIQAATQAAADWNTYVTAHVYNTEGIRRAIDNGVKSIEHANLIDEDTLRYMKKHDVWLSPQVIVYTYIPKGYTQDQAAKHRQAYAGIDNLFKTAKKIGFDKIAFGTDIITDPKMIAEMNQEFVHRTEWFTPAEIMKQATYNSAQLLALSGPRSPYPEKMGVIEEGAYADLLLIDGNPLDDITILTNPKQNLSLIMKDGQIYKNTIN